jgi:hypothetical protein
LNTSHSRVSIVPHDTIFPDRSCLPTFNSTSIELNLHRIPGLTKKFLYFNDDCFLGREISTSTFITDKGQYIYFQKIALRSDLNSGPVHDRAYAYTQNIVEKLWSQRRPRLLPAHAPQLYDRDIISHLEEMIPDEFRQSSSHKLRASNDVVLRILYSYYMLEHPDQMNLNKSILLKNPREYGYVELHDKPWQMRSAFWKIQMLRPKFFCINDDLGHVDKNHRVLLYLRRFLSSYFPHPSSFERGYEGDSI